MHIAYILSDITFSTAIYKGVKESRSNIKGSRSGYNGVKESRSDL